ncbi:hypothetical protein [Acidithrix ferrooxidans]|uniref:Uncharacterized protein n=1 Tax=Acidithrix ferrooxidans TaxID=1280514 RepID=A0A0D8HHW2_9ACTN|nr:hypothetical protein [Acidithrix ferrooxidans]KJF17347.1 hypothetical protein AXFE_17860 [Acidithrix ferrooxidans]
MIINPIVVISFILVAFVSARTRLDRIYQTATSGMRECSALQGGGESPFVSTLLNTWSVLAFDVPVQDVE